VNKAQSQEIAELIERLARTPVRVSRISQAKKRRLARRTGRR
jgi:hypothetical protein